MKKTKLCTKDMAKGMFIYTDILADKINAVYVIQEDRKKNEDAGTESQVLFIKNKDQETVYVLKTLSCPMQDVNTIAEAHKEFDLAAKLGAVHPNIARGIKLRELTGIAEQPQTIEALMEYGGENLLNLLMGRKLSGKDILVIAVQTASAMQYAHSQGVFHSDLKPQNIVYMDGVAKIIDFGVSLDLGGMTRHGAFTAWISENVFGSTLCYCPPEMYHKEKVAVVMHKLEELGIGKADPRLEKEIMETFGRFSREKIDVYMWGMTFYQLLAKKTIKMLCDEWESCRQSHEMYNKFKQEVQALKVEGPIDPLCAKQFILLLGTCLSFAAEDRPSFQVISDVWLAPVAAAMHVPIPKAASPTAKQRKW